jgi:hypothetical protein
VVSKLSESSMILVFLELTTESFLCALLAPAQCPLGRALQNSSEILSSVFKLSAEFFFSTTVHMLDAHLAELYRIHSRILSATMSSPT